MGAGRNLPSSTQQQQNAGMQQYSHARVQSTVTNDKLYTISDNKPLKKIVRNSREGS